MSRSLKLNFHLGQPTSDKLTNRGTMCDAIKKKKTSGIYVAIVWSRMKKKKKTSEKEAQNQRVHNQVIVQTKADLKMCIREY